jgi:hypothetical protein
MKRTIVIDDINRLVYPQFLQILELMGAKERFISNLLAYESHRQHVEEEIIIMLATTSFRVLVGRFDWSGSPEGFAFWENISNNTQFKLFK